MLPWNTMPTTPRPICSRASVLIVQKKFPAARLELEKYLCQQTNDAVTAKLAELCSQARADDPRTIGPFVDLFLRNHEKALAESMGGFHEKILATYRERIEAAWPGLGQRLSVDRDGACA